MYVSLIYVKNPRLAGLQRQGLSVEALLDLDAGPG